MGNLNTHSPGALYEAFAPNSGPDIMGLLRVCPYVQAWPLAQCGRNQTQRHNPSMLWLGISIPLSPLHEEVAAWQAHRDLGESQGGPAIYLLPGIRASNSSAFIRYLRHDRTLVKRAGYYLNNYKRHGHIIPSIAGLVLGVSRSTLQSRRAADEVSYPYG